MKFIGFDKTDENQRKFTYESTVVLSSDPPKYEVTYEDTGEKGYVECSNTFALKPVKTPQQNVKNVEIKEKVTASENKVINATTDSHENELKIPDDIMDEVNAELMDKRKPKTEATIKNIITDCHKYEYKTVLDDLENVENRLNELGDDCWELVNFEVIQNLMKSPKLFCILKRNKTN